GAVVFREVDDATRAAQLQRLHETCPGLTAQVVEEEFSVGEDPSAEIGIVDGVFQVDRMTTARAGVVALTVGQSAAMEYYEKIVDALTAGTTQLVDRLEQRGAVAL